MQYMRPYKVYYKKWGSKAKQGDSLTVLARNIEHARNEGKSELRRRGRFTIIKVRMVRR